MKLELWDGANWYSVATENYVNNISVKITGDVSGSGALSGGIATTLASTINRTGNQLFNFTGAATSFNYDLTIPNSVNQTINLRMNRANTGNGAGYEFQFFAPTNGIDTFTFGYNSGSQFGSIYSLANNSTVFTFNSYRLAGLVNPINAQDAATKNYVDNKVFNINLNTTGSLNINRLQGYPSSSNAFLRGDGAWTLPYINNLLINGDVSFASFKIVNLANPTNSQDAATKSYVDNKVFDINSNTSGQLNINRLSGYPSNASVYLNGNGGWSDPLQLTVNSTSYNVNINNTNSAATFTGFAALSNGITTAQFGYNGSKGTSYIWSSNSLLFYTNSTAQMQLLSNGTLNLFSNNMQTTGNISAQTGTLIANNLAAYNSGVIVCANALTIQDTGTYKPYNGGYGYLNASGSVGTFSGQNPYSINCNNRVKASEFNAVSSIKTKNIEAYGEAIEQEALDLFNKIPFFKYNYKDKIKNGVGVSFGVVAENLKEVLPDYVSEDDGFVPNIFQACSIKAKNQDNYELVFKKKLGDLEGDKLQLTLSDKSIEVFILEKRSKSLLIYCPQTLPNEGFAYGTFESCPSVTKNKLFELSMVVLGNVLKRLIKLEGALA